ncbi:NAD binding domain of 6-phosphogluconate dehydrogenase-domain-containing protein [Xylariomycetidae sp. FL2044]|nr:NAD binding domain of 6-phosphogluconate dehydrogenase-domain-containing protein [Xylariomycetidae sp. FL2044]
MSTDAKPEIAFIGLGAMGFGMATHLVSRSYPVTGFDVWPPTLERFRAAGGSTAATPADAVRDRAFCVCMVATAAQAQAVLFEGEHPAVPALPRGAALLLSSTVPCAYVRALEAQLRDAGREDVLLVDCPVSGGSTRAAEGTLSIMAGGSEAALARARFLLEELADPDKLYVVRGGVGAGSNMKMVHQVLAAVQILAASEGMGFAAHLGLEDGAATSRAVLASDARSWFFEHRVPRILDPDHLPVASAVTIILKDTGIITSEARRAGFPTPMASTAEQVYFSALGRGYGADDDAGLVRLYTEGRGTKNIGPVKGAAETEERKLELVKSLLRGIYVCAAAESLAFAKRCDLDLDQVFELCVNAAGGSKMLEVVGPEIMAVLRGEKPTGGEGGEKTTSLGDLAGELQDAVAEAQLLKCPVYLGSQALTLVRLALQHAPKEVEKVPRAVVVKVWT